MRSIIALLTVLLTGCYFGDYDSHPECWDCGQMWDSGEYYYDDDYDEGESIRVEPDEIAPGDAIIAAIVGDGQVNFERAVEIHFLGDIDVITFDVHNEQVMLVTIYAAMQAAEGPVDMMIEYANGEADFLKGALQITPGTSHTPEDEKNPCG